MPEKITLDYSYVYPFISDDDINKNISRWEKALDTVLQKSGTGADFLGWLNLPEETLKSGFLKEISAVGEEIFKNADLLIVIGIGGSYLGAKAVTNSFLHPFHNSLSKTERKAPKLLYAGFNISGRYHEALLEEIEKSSSVYVNVISKSGTTTEPGIAFRLIKDALEKKYGKTESAKRIIATTDEKKGALRELSVNEGYRTFVIPDDVGGRYSVLTPVGLLPIAAVGIDINNILKGAHEASLYGKVKDTEKNPALLYAVIRNILLEKGYTTEILLNYEPALQYISEWWKQLFGESEGKNGKGIFPASVEFTTDLHSMGQWIQEGQRFIFETILSINKPTSVLKVPKADSNLDELEYLKDVSFYEINKKAFEGTLIAHHDGKSPNMIFNIPELTSYHIGELLYTFEMSCAISGYILGINPFDQPGVEAYKNNMFALLNKPSGKYAELRKTLDDKIKSIPKGKITK
jgi:glucose-6-phosphate isomerase